ncbi:MAG: hypothetical protein SP1CHLAM54_04120 [Chlamydiia bacterium]|nr:hypothetical protein [Chlamydiia bacterium]MCH9615327.1 hypothetical protein [Chlamydiia bacterium]MCH9628351.1 hypothetical protein [Chlamydiia bacterium]
MIDSNFSKDQGTVSPYIWGVILSILLTLAAYFVTVNNVLTGGTLFAALIVLGAVQVILQLFLFLQIGGEGKPHTRLFYLIYMVCIGAIIIAGTLWIMGSLQKRMEIKVDEYQRIVR